MHVLMACENVETETFCVIWLETRDQQRTRVSRCELCCTYLITLQTFVCLSSEIISLSLAESRGKPLLLVMFCFSQHSPYYRECKTCTVVQNFFWLCVYYFGIFSLCCSAHDLQKTSILPPSLPASLPSFRPSCFLPSLNLSLSPHIISRWWGHRVGVTVQQVKV